MSATDPAPAPSVMQWGDALSTASDLADAVADCAAQLALLVPAESLPFDLLFAFCAPDYPGIEHLPALLAEAVPHVHLLGCGGRGLIATGREIEFSPALALVGARLPGVTIRPFHLTAGALSDAGPSPSEWERLLGVPRQGPHGPEQHHFVVLADPFTFPAEDLIAGLDFAYAGARVAGGLASGADAPGGSMLFLDGTTLREGAVGVALEGALEMETVVAQGVRPVGPSFMVTRAEAHLLQELDGEPSLAVLGRMFGELDEEEQELARHALFLGVAQNAGIDAPEHGEYLIRNMLGVTQDESALVVGERLRAGQLVRFHVRDAESSSGDLVQMLGAYRSRREEGPAAAGALLFSCLGRGLGLYGESGHDSRVFGSVVGPVPLGGFFCNGEIGPVGDATYLHGYTSVFAVFHPPLD
ncbi:MAG: FIST C-terminal domain-containing protein [Nitrospirota bacterium]|nr:FIST C-terminal domain-containing protein [Nitrospirota bacterium]